LPSTFAFPVRRSAGPPVHPSTCPPVHLYDWYAVAPPTTVFTI
jgi:hypothetical protein